jgi:flavin reductase (DIM6/NTAB) family NADH-FMN oxidoreductase RutF
MGFAHVVSHIDIITAEENAMKKSFGPKTLIYPTPVWIIGTYDKEGKPNAMTVAWGGVCSSQPPCVAVSIRKATYSHAAIIARKAFSVNVPSESHVTEADYCGIYSGKSMDKFSATGLTAVKGDRVDAPYIKEFPLILECRLASTSEVGIHTLFIGEIVDVKADESILGENGLPDMLKVKPILYAPEVRLYYGVGKYLGQAHAIGKKI